MRCQAYRNDGRRCNRMASDGVLCDSHMIMNDMNNFGSFDDWNLNMNTSMGLASNLGMYSDLDMYGMWNSLGDWSFPVIDYIPIPVFGGGSSSGSGRDNSKNTDGRYRDLADFCQLNLQHLIKTHPDKMVLGILDVHKGFANPKVVHLKGYKGRGRMDSQDLQILKRHASIAVVFISSPTCKAKGVPSVSGHCPPLGSMIASAHNRSLDGGFPILFVLMDRHGCWIFSPTRFALTKEANSHPMIGSGGIIKVADTLATALMQGKIDTKKYLEDCQQAFGRFCRVGLYPFFTEAPAKSLDISKLYSNASTNNAQQWDFSSDVA